MSEPSFSQMASRRYPNLLQYLMTVSIRTRNSGTSWVKTVFFLFCDLHFFNWPPFWATWFLSSLIPSDKVFPKLYLEQVTFILSTKSVFGLPGGSISKKSAYNAGDLGSIPGSGRFFGEGYGNPLQSVPGEFHGQRSLVGYSPWVRKNQTQLSN